MKTCLLLLFCGAGAVSSAEQRVPDFFPPPLAHAEELVGHIIRAAGDGPVTGVQPHWDDLMGYGEQIVPGLERCLEEAHRRRRDYYTARLIKVLEETERHFGVTNVSPLVVSILNDASSPPPLGPRETARGYLRGKGAAAGKDTPAVSNVVPAAACRPALSGQPPLAAAPRTPAPAAAGPADTPAPPAAGPPDARPPRPRSAVPLAVGAGVLSALLLLLRFWKKARRM
jgi:hypothetical protein